MILNKSLFKSGTENKERDFIEAQLYWEILKSEKIRVTMLGIVSLVPFIFLTLLLLFAGDRYLPQQGQRDAIYFVDVILVIFSIREFWVRKIIARRLSQRKTIPEWGRYMNSLIEISIPSFLLLLLGIQWQSVIVLSTPITYFYFIIILLTTLSLDSRLSLLTGLVAFLEYGLILFYLLNRFEYPEQLNQLNEWYIHGGKLMLVLLSGVISGFVANQMRTRIYNTFEIFSDRNRVVNLFNQQVSQEIVEELISQHDEFKSKRKFVAVMFLDIRGFTQFVQSLEPEEIIDYQNKVFGFMIDIILKNHGIINQFLGDGYMATFGAPISKGNDVQNAVNAAIQIIEELHQRNINKKMPETNLGIGLHAGYVVAGNVGTDLRKQYSISGNTVILASRIEQLNKHYNSKVLVSEEVLNEINRDQLNIECLGEVDIKGREKPLNIFKLA